MKTIMLFSTFASIFILILVQCMFIDAIDSNSPEIIGKHPVFLSEYQLRNLIVDANKELSQLKRDFITDITDNYITIKEDSDNGFRRARRGETAGIAMTLMGEEFADIIVKRHIIERRLASGLRVIFHKFLSIKTLKRLVEKFKSYSWLKDLNQVDLRPKFPNTDDKQFIQLYKIIQLRAYVRAGDDITALTEENIKRIFKTIKWFLIDLQGGKALSSEELVTMSEYAQKILHYYKIEILEKHEKLQEEYTNYMEQAADLKNAFGGEIEFIKFIDNLIDSEALDIDLNKEATTMSLPPTINESMIDNIRKKWIPEQVLDSITEDRKVLLMFKLSVKGFVKLEEQDLDVDVGSWCTKVSQYLAEETLESQ